MEYAQDLENLKTDTNKTGKTIDGLTELMQSFSGMSRLQETIKNFQEDKVLTRIETKLDIIAQEDHAGILNILIEQLNEELTQKYNLIIEKLNEIKPIYTAESIPQITDELSDVNAIVSILSENHRQIKSDLSDIRNSMPDLLDIKKINDLENNIKNQEEYILRTISDIYGNTSGINDGFLALNQSLQSKLSEIEENICDRENLINEKISHEFQGIKENFTVQNDIAQKSLSILENTATIGEVRSVKSSLITFIGDRLNSVDDVKKNLSKIKSDLNYIIDNLYPVHNLQNVSESIQGMQEKINQLVAELYNNSDNQKNTEENFENLKNALSEINQDSKQSLDEIIQTKQRVGKILSEEILLTNQKLNEIVEGINTNNSSNLKTEENFEDVKKALSSLNQNNDFTINEIREVKDVLGSIIGENLQSTEKKLNDFMQGNFDEFKSALSSINIDNNTAIKEIKEIKNNLGSIIINNLQSSEEKINSFIQSNFEDVKGSLSILGEGNNAAIEEIREAKGSLGSIVVNTVQSIEEKLNLLINENFGNINENLSLLSHDNNLTINEISLFKNCLGSIICDNLQSTEEKINSFVQGNFDDIKGTLSILGEGNNTSITEIRKVKDSLGIIIGDNLQPTEEKLRQLIDDMSQNTSLQHDIKDQLNYITENLYPVQNLQSVNEKLEYMQDKVSAIFSNIDTNNNAYSETRDNLEDIKVILSSINQDNIAAINEIRETKEALGSIFGDNLQASEDKLNNLIQENFGHVQTSLSSINQTNNASIKQIQEIKASFGSMLGSYLQSTEDKLNEFNKDKFDYINELLAQIGNTNSSTDEKLIHLQEKICEVLNNLDTNNKNHSDTYDTLENIKISLSSINHENTTAINELRGIKHNLGSVVENKLQTTEEKINSFVQANFNNINELLSQLDNGNGSTAQEIREIKNTLNSLQADNSQSLDEKLVYLQEKICEVLSNLDTNNNAYSETRDNLEDIKVILSSINQDNIAAINEIRETKEALGSIFGNNLQIAEDKLNDLIRGNFDYIKGALSNLKIDNNTAITEIREIKGSIGAIVYDNLQSSEGKLSKLLDDSNERHFQTQTNLEDIKSNLHFISRDIGNDFTDKISVLDEKLTNISENLYPVQNLQSINEQFEAAQDKLNSLLEVINMNSPENLRTSLDIDNKFADLNFKLDSTIGQSISSVKECVNEILEKQYNTEEIKNALSFLNHGLEKIAENLKYGPANNISEEVLNTLLNDVNLIKASVNSNVSTTNLKEIDEKINNLDSKLASLQEMSLFRENFNYIKDYLCQLEEKFNYTNEKISDLANFTSIELDRDIAPVNEQLNKLQTDLTARINHNAEVLNEFLGIFNSKIEVLKYDEDIRQIKDGIHHLSEKAKGSSDILSGLCEDAHKAGELQTKVENINEQLKFVSTSKEVKELHEKIDVLTEEIRNYREKLASENTEELMNAILDNLISLNENIDSRNDVNNQELLGSLQEINESTFRSENRITLASEAIIDIKKDFSALSEGISGFDEDISDINSKINKLIISSNDNAGSLKHDIKKDLEVLKEEIKYNLENHNASFDRSGQNVIDSLSGELRGITDRIERIHAVSEDGLNSSNITKEAIIQMAEWIDSAGKLLEDNYENSKKTLVIRDKFENFEVRLESIEAKLEKILDRYKADR